MVLNIAEGAPHGRDPEGKRHYRIALRSAAEAAAVLALLPTLPGADQKLVELPRVGAMLGAMTR